MSIPSQMPSSMEWKEGSYENSRTFQGLLKDFPVVFKD